jgi:hypothetical protein
MFHNQMMCYNGHLINPWCIHMANETMTHFTLRMDPTLRQRAEKAAAADHRPLSSLVKKLLSDHCEGREPAAEDRLPKRGGRK